MKTVKGEDCYICGAERWYKTERNAKLSEYKPCRSCANSLSLGGEGMAYTEDGKKLCNDCRERPQKYNSVCNECAVKRRKKYYREVMRYERYGITKEWFDTRFTGSCEICGTAVGRFDCHIDHCHESGKVRGILCQLCNKGLGQFKDNKEALKKAIEYLEANG